MIKTRTRWFPACALMASLSLAAVSVVAHDAAPVPSNAAPPKASVGVIVGRLTNAEKMPIAGATVTAVRADGGAIRATISSSDGVYSFADLAPGLWSLTVQADGVPEATTPSLQVNASLATRRDLIVPGAIAAANPVTPPSAASNFAAVTARLPEALQEPAPAPENDPITPWADIGYVGWMNGTSREKAPIFDTKFFTPEIRLDMNYLQSLNHPHDHTIVGSTEEFRSGEFQIEQVSLGGDFHWDNVRARFLSMFGMFATTTPRNDASSSVGQWDLQNAYRYFSEASAGISLRHRSRLERGCRRFCVVHRFIQLLQF